MGMDLFGRNKLLSISGRAWEDMLDLAHHYGWKPQGTIAVAFEEWRGDLSSELELAKIEKVHGRDGYHYNAGYIVTTSDAGALAEALENAIQDRTQPFVKCRINFSIDTPEKLATAEFEYMRRMMSGSGARIGLETTNLNSEDDDLLPVTLIKSLIEICRAGPFRIG